MRKFINSSLIAIAIFAATSPAQADTRRTSAREAQSERSDHNRREPVQYVQSSRHSHAAKSVKAKFHGRQHKYAVGHRFDRKKVVVVQDWHRRGLPSPRRNEVYLISGNDIYLATAASLIAKALIN